MEEEEKNEFLSYFLCTALESRTGKKIDDHELFYDILRNVYIGSENNITTITDNFKNDARELMLGNKEESNSPMMLLCELIYDGIESGTVTNERKLFEDALICLYMAHKIIIRVCWMIVKLTLGT